ncbi:MAG: family 20 glycosylhydrolase, partial [Mangrovimonas sp.]|nr:family 20 glycosylhydrolase [Mangrovimonas sp.]
AYPFLSCFPKKPTEIPNGMASQASVVQQEAGQIKLVQETSDLFDDISCAGKDSTSMFLENVPDEVVGLFPSKYIHIGGDEAPKKHWEQCPNCQKRMKELGLKNEHELQSYFVTRIEKYLNAKGKQIIGWDEILEGGLAPNATVMSWRGESGAMEATEQQHQVILTPNDFCYFDHYQSKDTDKEPLAIGGFTPLEEVYNYNPVSKEMSKEQANYVLGAQGNVWTEYITTPEHVEYMVFPRIFAMSEIDWTLTEKKNYQDFKGRTENFFKRLKAMNVNYANHLTEKHD